MKLIILLFVLACFVANSLALKNSICGQLSSYNPGRCLALFRNWTYDSAKNECVEFTYGGCGGNENNFGSWGECVDACVQ